MRSTYVMALALIFSSITFMAASIYLVANNMALASIISLASGLLALSGGLSIMRMHTECSRRREG